MMRSLVCVFQLFELEAYVIKICKTFELPHVYKIVDILLLPCFILYKKVFKEFYDSLVRVAHLVHMQSYI